MRNNLLPFCMLCSVMLALGACQASKPRTPPKTASPGFFQGTATVLEIHNALGYALLNVDGKEIYGYWDTDPAVGQTSTIAHSGAFGSAVGEAKDPVVHHQDFPAKVGDTIVFRGMKTQGDIYLSGIRIIQK